MNMEKYFKYKNGEYVERSHNDYINLYETISRLNEADERRVISALHKADERQDKTMKLLVVMVLLLGVFYGGIIGYIFGVLEALA